jgi:glycosyltransferase involved in cell wall biosynthesis
MTDRWHLITGEYPPRQGGVADYTALLAAALAMAGSDVHVWTTEGPDSGTTDGVTVHRPAGGWSPFELAHFEMELDAFPPPRRLVVQYAPNAWGYKGMNIGFCRWLLRRRRLGDDVRVMFHEVWYAWRLWDKPTRWALAVGQRMMARTLMEACSSAYVSIPGWEPLLRASEKGARRPITWLPVPSTIAVVDDAPAVAELRSRLAPRGQQIIGSFGTFGGMIGSMLAEILPRLLERHDDRVGLLFGRGSDRFAARLVAERPELTGRLIAAGALSPSEVSIHLQACDLLVQPYPDGLSTRRTTLMAGLAHGVATVSNLGALSEPVWGRSPCVALAPSSDLSEVVVAAESVLACPERRAELGAAGREMYRRDFAVERTVEVIRGTASDRINK